MRSCGSEGGPGERTTCPEGERHSTFKFTVGSCQIGRFDRKSSTRASDSANRGHLTPRGSNRGHLTPPTAQAGTRLSAQPIRRTSWGWKAAQGRESRLGIGAPGGDSNPRPSDPKSASRQGERRESIRAWNGHREDADFVDSGVSQDPAPERVLIPSRELERVRCPRRDRLSSDAHDERPDYTPRR